MTIIETTIISLKDQNQTLLIIINSHPLKTINSNITNLRPVQIHYKVLAISQDKQVKIMSSYTSN